MVVPDGWLPIPPAPGAWAGPSYVGRPASPHQVPAEEVPPNPHRSAGEPADLPGPLGHQPEVDTAWFGLQRCGRLELTATGLLVALCAAGDGRALRVVDPETLRPMASQDLPDLPEGSACDGRVPLPRRRRTGRGRAPVTARCSPCGRPTRASRTSQTDATWDLKPYVAYGDCLVSVAPDWSGRIWWASHAGLVGTLDPTTGQVGVVDLGEEVRHDVAVDPGAAYVVTDEAVHRLVVGGDGTPQVTWRSEYDGVSGSAPVLVDRGTVAITDEVEDRLGVRFLARDDGRTVCRQSVFDKGEGATRSTLADLGAGVVVANDAGYASSRRALLGFTAGAGVARVDLVDDGCAVTLDHRRRVACLGRRRQPPQRAALRLGQAAVADRRQRVVPHGDRRRLRPPPLGRAHRHRAARRQRRLDGHARPRRLGLPRHAGRAGPGARPPLGPSRRPGEPDRLLAALPQPPLRHLVARQARGADDPRRTGGLAGAARADVRRPREVGGGGHQASAGRRPRRTARPALTAPSRIGRAPAAGACRAAR